MKLIEKSTNIAYTFAICIGSVDVVFELQPKLEADNYAPDKI